MRTTGSHFGSHEVLMSHLVYRNGTYYWRRRLPRVVADLLGREYLWRSLRTGRVREAQELARQITATTDRIFSAVTKPDGPSAATVDRLLRQYIEEALRERSEDFKSVTWEAIEDRDESLEVSIGVEY